MRGVEQHAPLPRAEAQTPERPAQDAAPDAARAQKGIARREPAHAEAHEGGTPADRRGHERKAQGDHERLPGHQRFRPDAGIGRLDGLDRRAVLPGEGPQRIPGPDAAQPIAREPGPQRAEALRARDAVRRQALPLLKAAQRRLRRRTEDPVGLKRTEARPVQGELQQLHRRALASSAQHPHAIPSFGRASPCSICASLPGNDRSRAVCTNHRQFFGGK